MLLTSHYMADVEALCRRVVVIHHGRLLFDGSSPSSCSGSAAHKTIVVRLADCNVDAVAYGEVGVVRGGARHAARAQGGNRAVTARLLADLPVIDLTVEDPPIEEVIERVFAQEAP